MTKPLDCIAPNNGIGKHDFVKREYFVTTKINAAELLEWLSEQIEINAHMPVRQTEEYVSRAIKREEMFKTCRTLAAEVVRLEKENLKLKKKNRLLEQNIWKCGECGHIFSAETNSEMDKLQKRVEDLEGALRHIAGGCLVPPDGGCPNIYDYIDTAKAALAAKQEGE